jgi:hypothetical protein
MVGTTKVKLELVAIQWVQKRIDRELKIAGLKNPREKSLALDVAASMARKPGAILSLQARMPKLCRSGKAGS